MKGGGGIVCGGRAVRPQCEVVNWVCIPEGLRYMRATAVL